MTIGARITGVGFGGHVFAACTPDAVPAVIAVRDPNLCEDDSEETVAYVRILVPPQPLRSLEISPCRTKLTLCFGQYDVLICSSNGRITVEYDN